MNSGQMFEEKRKYVEALSGVLKAIEDFDYIKYARSYITEQEYIKIADKLGGCVFLNVTAMDNASILREVAILVLGKVSKNCVLSTDAKRKIAKLFN